MNMVDELRALWAHRGIIITGIERQDRIINVVAEGDEVKVHIRQEDPTEQRRHRETYFPPLQPPPCFRA